MPSYSNSPPNGLCKFIKMQQLSRLLQLLCRLPVSHTGNPLAYPRRDNHNQINVSSLCWREHECSLLLFFGFVHGEVKSKLQVININNHGSSAEPTPGGGRPWRRPQTCRCRPSMRPPPAGPLRPAWRRAPRARAPGPARPAPVQATPSDSLLPGCLRPASGVRASGPLRRAAGTAFAVPVRLGRKPQACNLVDNLFPPYLQLLTVSYKMSFQFF